MRGDFVTYVPENWNRDCRYRYRIQKRESDKRPGELSKAPDKCLARDEPAFLKANVDSGPLPKALEPFPFDGLDGTYRFRQALVDEGLVESWTDVTPVHYTFKK
jgi:hypothetical protein